MYIASIRIAVGRLSVGKVLPQKIRYRRNKNKIESKKTNHALLCHITIYFIICTGLLRKSMLEIETKQDNVSTEKTKQIEYLLAKLAYFITSQKRCVY